jgi:hypothetical protein
MTKATVGHRRVTISRSSGVAGMNGELPKAADIVETICATAYTDGKTDGVYAAALDVLAQRLQVSQQTLSEALVAGIGRGWLRQGTGHCWMHFLAMMRRSHRSLLVQPLDRRRKDIQRLPLFRMSRRACCVRQRRYGRATAFHPLLPKRVSNARFGIRSRSSSLSA